MNPDGEDGTESGVSKAEVMMEEEDAAERTAGEETVKEGPKTEATGDTKAETEEDTRKKTVKRAGLNLQRKSSRKGNPKRADRCNIIKP